VSPSANATIGIGIVGTGGIAHAHAMGCKANPHVKVVALAEIRDGVAEAYAERHGFDARIFTDYRDLIAMDGVDAVTVCTPNNVHAPVSIAAIEAGKHVLSEKPMASTLADAEAMVAASEKADVRTMVGFTKRFFRGNRFLHDLLRSEDLGRIYHVRACYFQSWLSNPSAPMAWRLRKEETGTGVLGDLGSHVTDLAQYIVGDPISRVTGMLKTFTTQRPMLADTNELGTVDVDDAAVFCVEFENGAMGVIEASRNATGHPDFWRLEINGEKGAVIYDNVEGKVLLSTLTGPARRGGWITLPVPARYGTPGTEFAAEVSHFVDCIRSGDTPSPTFAEGLRTERVMDAVVRSAESGRAVDVQAV
jgi:predicted dehydrogenase|tara:strand:+ start:5722 stop:6810 length:1089 start_codon:yes stop_codon:yes gene_type:complete